jgi:hypothetical protein
MSMLIVIVRVSLMLSYQLFRFIKQALRCNGDDIAVVESKADAGPCIASQLSMSPFGRESNSSDSLKWSGAASWCASKAAFDFLLHGYL